MPVRGKHIRSLADKTLANQRILSAPVPVEGVARSLGAEVIYEPNDDDLAGFLLRDYARQRAVIGVNAKHHPNRQRFTIAHEIGHLLLHDHEGLHMDGITRWFQLRRRDERSSTGTDDEEREANLFAAELLMPDRFLEADLAQITELDLLDEDRSGLLEMLAKRYGVSLQALTYRLANLEFIHL